MSDTRHRTARSESATAADRHTAGPLSLTALIEAVTTAVPDRAAVVTEHREVTFARLDERATRLAWGLRSLGTTPGENVAILAFNRVEWLEAMFGVLRAGAVPVNVNYRYVAEELRYVLADSDAAVLIGERSLLGPIAPVRAEIPTLREVVAIDDGHPDPVIPDAVDFESLLRESPTTRHGLHRSSGDDRYMIYTGGTTGYPKGVMWRQEDIFRVALERRASGVPGVGSPEELGARAATSRGKRLLALGPLMHAAGQWTVLSTLLGGHTAVLNTDRAFDPRRIVALADRERVRTVQCVGDAMARPIARQLLTEPHRCADLRTVMSGGTPLTAPVRELWRSWRPDITFSDSYGGSETGVCGAGAPQESSRYPRFTVGSSVAVLDERLRPLPPGSERIGRIARTGRIPLGYYNDPARTAWTFPTDPDGRRWAISGDYGRVTEDGTIVLLGRGSQVINTGGEKVYPEEVESVLKSHPDVVDTIVLSAPDERLGQRVAAVISLSSNAGPDEERLRDHCRERLAGFKVPRQIHIVPEVKRTAVGKQDYRWAAAIVTRETVPSG